MKFCFTFALAFLLVSPGLVFSQISPYRCGSNHEINSNDIFLTDSFLKNGQELFKIQNQLKLNKSSNSSNAVGGFEPGLHIPVKFHLILDDNGLLSTNPIGGNFQEVLNNLV